MYMSIIFLLSWLCAITAQITYDRSNQGITSMSGYSIPGNTEQVWFHQNSLTHVQAGYFKNLPYLTQIYLYSNDISSVDDFAFVQVPSLTYISLGNNKLSVIRKNMFSGLPHLASLALNDNMINTIESGTFKDNTALTWLSLYGNQLETLNQCIFDPENHPCSLELWLWDNPLSCNESLCWLKQATWITVDYASSTVCTGPGTLNGQTWNMITTDDLNCDTSGR